MPHFSSHIFRDILEDPPTYDYLSFSLSSIILMNQKAITDRIILNLDTAATDLPSCDSLKNA